MEMFLFLSIGLSIVAFISILLSPAPIQTAQVDTAEDLLLASNDSCMIDLEPSGVVKIENHQYSIEELEGNYRHEVNDEQLVVKDAQFATAS